MDKDNEFAVFILISMLLLSIFVGCTGTIQQINEESNREKVLLLDSHRAGDQLSLTGRQLTVAKCIDCHRYYRRDEYTPREWNTILQWKAKRLRLKSDQLDALLSYYVTHDQRQNGR